MERTVKQVTRQVFECPICKSIHVETDTATNCANDHLEVVGIAVRYVGSFSLPDVLWLTFEDGSHLYLDWNEEGYMERESIPPGEFIRLFGTDAPQNEKRPADQASL